MYNSNDKKKWDEFVEKSKNGTFLFYRDYMDYHSDRFVDNSLIIFDRDQVISLLPASIQEDEISSHGGLTYGGFITDEKMTTPLMMDIFKNVILNIKEGGVSKFIYKTIPHIYHRFPAEEDKYALFLNNARLVSTDVMSVIDLARKIPFQERRKRSLRKAKENKLFCRITDDFPSFWKILTHNLEKYHQIYPVHTVEEMRLLQDSFKENIKLFASYFNNTMLAGVVIYESENVAHAQYTTNSEEGREKGALDIVFDYLINDYYKKNKKYFDFGISTEKDGRYLNLGLVEYKESYGARSVMHDFYEIDIQRQ